MSYSSKQYKWKWCVCLLNLYIHWIYFIASKQSEQKGKEKKLTILYMQRFAFPSPSSSHKQPASHPTFLCISLICLSRSSISIIKSRFDFFVNSGIWSNSCADGRSAGSKLSIRVRTSWYSGKSLLISSGRLEGLTRTLWNVVNRCMSVLNILSITPPRCFHIRSSKRIKPAL